jgi:hypothetical protein
VPDGSVSGVTRYRPPRDCPVCSSRLQITQLGCTTCGTGLTGEFRPCEFCGLDDAERDLLRVFLASRGNMKELERHLGVSYPTARARFEDLLRKLDLDAPADAPARAREPWAEPRPQAPAEDPRLATLRSVAAGDLAVDQARTALAGPPTP